MCEAENRRLAAMSLSHGERFPYDASDAWWNGSGETPPPSGDWAHAAARGIVADLQDRGGIKHGFVEIDEEIRAEIVGRMAAIIRIAKEIGYVSRG